MVTGMGRCGAARGSIAIVMAMVSAVALGLNVSCNEEGFVCTEAGERDLYEKRIAPLLADERPSSCNECHLAGVDLSLFVQASPCQTMACMVDRGVVDLEDPEASIVLGWIERAEAASPLVTEAMIREEYDGMLEWIRFSAHCGQLECEPMDDPCGAPPSALDCGLESPEGSQPFDDPGDCDERTLEALFAAKVYPWRGRCFPCHFADETSEIGAPPWIQVGECDVGSLATMREVLARGYVDINVPAQSLLLLKPLAESEGGVVHGGHDKIASTDEDAYVDFLAWLQRYAECR
jgi:hypothetical protein